jgi:hypothetical protein
MFNVQQNSRPPRRVPGGCRGWQGNVAVTTIEVLGPKAVDIGSTKAVQAR